MIESLNQLHSSSKKFLVRDSLPSPPFQDLINPVTFFAAELTVSKVSVMNDLGNHPHSTIANLEILLQGLEGAVLPAMPKAAVIHIKWNRLAWHPILRSEGKSRFSVDELPNEPRRRRPIDTWARSGDPQFAFILSW